MSEQAHNAAIIYCKCGIVLGIAGQHALTLGAAVLNRTVTINCVACGESYTWYSPVKNIARENKTCNNVAVPR